jgi:hypothetical protein
MAHIPKQIYQKKELPDGSSFLIFLVPTYQDIISTYQPNKIIAERFF